MAEEKPSTCIAAKLWLSDQRSRWNDLGSLHLADIDLLLDKQLQWISDHTTVESLLNLAPSQSNVSSPNTYTVLRPSVPESIHSVEYPIRSEEKHASPAPVIMEANERNCDTSNNIVQVRQDVPTSSTADNSLVKTDQEEVKDEEYHSFHYKVEENLKEQPDGTNEPSSIMVIKIDENQQIQETAQLESESETVPSNVKPTKKDDFNISDPMVAPTEKVQLSIPEVHRKQEATCVADVTNVQEIETVVPDMSSGTTNDQQDTNTIALESGQPVENVQAIRRDSHEKVNTENEIETNDIQKVIKPQSVSGSGISEAAECKDTVHLDQTIQDTEKVKTRTAICEKSSSSPIQAIPCLASGLKTNVLRKDSIEDIFESNELPSIPNMPVFTEPSPLESTKPIVDLYPSQENIPPGTTPFVTETKHVTTGSSSGSPYDDQDDDADEIILVGDKSSARWSRSAIRRLSKMPPMDRTRPPRRTLQVPERQVKVSRTTSTPLTKTDEESVKANIRPSKTLSTALTKSPTASKAPLDGHETSNILWVNSTDLPTDPKSIDENQSASSTLPGSRLMAKLRGVYDDKSSSLKQGSDGSSPIERLERRLDEVLQDVDRNSIEINTSQSKMHQHRQHPNSKIDLVRSRLRNHMSPTMSHLKRLEVQKASHHKLQAKLMSVQPTHSSSINKDKYSTNAPVYTSGWQARPESTKPQTLRKKRLGILNGMNAERLKLIQQRSKLQERDLQASMVKGSGNLHSKTNVASTRDANKVAPSHSFAKSTLSTQLKTHKPMESMTKALHSQSTGKQVSSIASKAHNNELMRMKAMAPTDRQTPASTSSSQPAINLVSATPSKKDTQVIPKATDKNKGSQDDDSRPRKKPKLPIPGWAMSPELKKALEEQCSLNPEEIFGKMAPLRIEGDFVCCCYFGWDGMGWDE
ncbi:hypothetical protein BGW37DRAFT_500621 [Umbelopsis sp. PMI_123]|nr:hypothetical protein BGW37DRAFT_500621 [Umbelopsis sp. PMI_123]